MAILQKMAKQRLLFSQNLIKFIIPPAKNLPLLIQNQIMLAATTNLNNLSNLLIRLNKLQLLNLLLLIPWLK